jgi:hypothetical protein
MQHPEIREVLNDFISSVLLHKPVSSFERGAGVSNWAFGLE